VQRKRKQREKLQPNLRCKRLKFLPLVVIISTLSNIATIALAVEPTPAASAAEKSSSPNPRVLPPPPAPCRVESQQSAKTLDDLFAAVAEKVPEFAGMTYGPDEQTFKVYSTEVGKKNIERIRAAIVDVFGGEVVPKGGIQVIKVRYGFLQLKKWYDRMQSPIFGTPGVVLTDIDEAKNRLRIGVADKANSGAVAEQLRKLDIPKDAVSIEVTGPINLLSQTLQDDHSPRQGGYQILRLNCNQLGYSYSACTLGFNVKATCGLSGFVTNSHCTRFSWQADNASGCPPNDTFGGGCPGTVAFSVGCPTSCGPGYFWQCQPGPVGSPTYFIGTESVDPPGFSGGTCPSGQTCRWSESAFIAYDPAVSVAKGIITKTTAITTSLSNEVLTVSTTTPPPPPFPPVAFGPGQFGIVGAPSVLYLAGLTLNKVGRTTGWTQGTIQSTCMNVVFCDDLVPNRLLLCQYSVAHPTNDLVDGGDSGSPVFRILKPGTRAELYGMVWARTTNKVFIFSPIGGVSFQSSGIQSDLGTLNYVWP